ncbi:MerR family transcriptional regulator [Streptomyces sp. NPDC093252]|uniref:DNA polymerase III subunit beta family protein n=1 Tax=Streptomyces sp. NPDC093252 TaxID=3154980 RepID=UPI003431B448
MPIGRFARRSGLTPSALRFYADSGLLPPAEVDPVTGYRHYAPDQVPRAVALRGLREIGLPLPDIAVILDAGPEEAARLIDAHVVRVLGEAADVRRRADRLKSALTGPEGTAAAHPVAALKGPVLADAIEQVLAATAHDPRHPVLGAVRLEATPEAVTLTATDRYRLATRTLAPAAPATRVPWAATLDGDDLRAAVPGIRSSPLVRVETAAPDGVRLRLGRTGREDPYCRALPDAFPDHHAMVAALPEVTTRATLAKEPFLRALETHPEDVITLRLTPGAPTPPLSAVTGARLDIAFAVTTLYPAISTALGPDVLLDLRGPGAPATVRSADRGDLTTWAMPVRQPAPARREPGSPRDRTKGTTPTP